MEDEQTYHVNICGAPKCVTLKVNGQSLRSLVDTGAEVCLIREEVFSTTPGNAKLDQANIKLQAAGGESLTVVGQTVLKLKIGQQNYHHTFFVVSGLN